MMAWKLLLAAGLLGTVYTLRGYLLIRKNAKQENHKPEEQHSEYIEDLRVPFRSAEDYWLETENLSQTFSNESTIEQNKKGHTIISGFAGASRYVWDGEYLSVYAGQRLLKMDGHYISDVGGNKKFTWKNDCLSSFAGKKLFTVSSGIVSLVGEGPLYRYDEKNISEFGGQKLLTMKGDVVLPEAIVGVLVIMIRNFVDMD